MIQSEMKEDVSSVKIETTKDAKQTRRISADNKMQKNSKDKTTRDNVEQQGDVVQEQLLRKVNQRRASDAMDVEKMRRIREDAEEAKDAEEKAKARWRHVQSVMDRERLDSISAEYDLEMEEMQDRIANAFSVKATTSEEQLALVLEDERDRIKSDYERRVNRVECGLKMEEERSRQLIEELIATDNDRLEREINKIEAVRASEVERIDQESSEKLETALEQFDKEKNIEIAKMAAKDEQLRRIGEINEDNEVEKEDRKAMGQQADALADAEKQRRLSVSKHESQNTPSLPVFNKRKDSFRSRWTGISSTPDSSAVASVQDHNPFSGTADPEIQAERIENEEKKKYRAAMTRRASLRDIKLSLAEENRARETNDHLEKIVETLESKLNATLSNLMYDKEQDEQKLEDDSIVAQEKFDRKINTKNTKFLEDTERDRRIREELAHAEIVHIEQQAAAALVSLETSFEQARLVMLEKLAEDETNEVRRESRILVDRASEVERNRRNSEAAHSLERKVSSKITQEQKESIAKKAEEKESRISEHKENAVQSVKAPDANAKVQKKPSDHGVAATTKNPHTRRNSKEKRKRSCVIC